MPFTVTVGPGQTRPGVTVGLEHYLGPVGQGRPVRAGDPDPHPALTDLAPQAEPRQRVDHPPLERLHEGGGCQDAKGEGPVQGEQVPVPRDEDIDMLDERMGDQARSE